MTDLLNAITLRPVQSEDNSFLLRLYASLRAEELALTGWDEAQKEAFLKMQLKAQRLDYERRFPAAEYRIVRVDTHPAGRIWVARSEMEIRLLDIGLLPEFRGRGIGTYLVRGLITEAEKLGKPLRHMVDKTNIRGIRFYGRLRFSIVGEVPTHFTMEYLPPPGAFPPSVNSD